jgi:hypothetical protein
MRFTDRETIPIVAIPTPATSPAPTIDPIASSEPILHPNTILFTFFALGAMRLFILPKDGLVRFALRTVFLRRCVAAGVLIELLMFSTLRITAPAPATVTPANTTPPRIPAAPAPMSSIPPMRKTMYCWYLK